MNLKSVGAVVAGVLFIVVGSILVDIVLHAAGVFPPMGQPMGHRLAALALAYRIVFSVGGGWLTAKLAPGRPMKHAVILGCVGVVLGLAGVVATWNKDLGPRWYAISLVVLAIPQCWLGAKIYELQSGRR